MGSKAYLVGIDSGSLNTKAVAMCNGEIVATSIVATEFDALKAAQSAYSILLDKAGISSDDVDKIASTGIGRSLVSFATVAVNEIIAAAAGANFAAPEANMVLDMGAETSRVIVLDEMGAAKNYEINDRCASGAGTFIEATARTLQIEPDEMGDFALRADKDITLKAQCVVFIESEVISLIHQKETRENIANGVHNGISNRLCSMFRRLGIKDGITFIGGPSRNQGLAASLSKDLGQQMIVPEHSFVLSAVGAALCAQKVVNPV
jgi:benzoyl-CoA reductase subunit D